MGKQFQLLRILMVLSILFSSVRPFAKTVEEDVTTVPEMSEQALLHWLYESYSENPRTSAPLFLKTAITFYNINSHDEVGFVNKGRLYRKAGTLYLDNETDSVNAALFYNVVKPLLTPYPEVRDYIADKVDFIRKQTTAGEQLPLDPTLIDQNGNRFKLSSVLAEGRIIYTDLWATSCIPCRREFPHLKKVSEYYSTENTDVSCLSLSIDTDFDRWKRFVEKNDFDWPHYMIDQKDAQRLFAHLRIMSIPRFLVISNKGIVLSVDAPRPSDENIHNYLDKIAKIN